MRNRIMDLQKGIGEEEQAIESAKQESEKTAKQIKKEQDIETFLELLRKGKSRKEAYEAVGHDKSWGSRVLTELKENDPDRLKGTSEEIKEEILAESIENQLPSQDIPQATQKLQTAPEPLQPMKSTPEEEKHVYMANTKPQKQSFSFRAEQTKIENWKLYAETIGAGDIGALWTAAIDEYITNHKLTEEQQVIYDLKKKIVEMQRKQK